MRYIILTILLITLSYSIPTIEDRRELEAQPRVDTFKETIKPLNIKINGTTIKTSFKKIQIAPEGTYPQGNVLPARIKIINIININGKKNEFTNISTSLVLNQNIIQTICTRKDKIILTLLNYYIFSGRRVGYIYEPYIYEIVNGAIVREHDLYRYELINGNYQEKKPPLNVLIYKNNFTSFNLSSQDVYPYSSKEEILRRLYETNFCSPLKVSLKSVEKNLKEGKKKYDTNFFANLVATYPLKKKNLLQYNNIAYYLEKVKEYKGAIFILKRVIKKFPKRTVAYINLGDAYWKLKKMKKAKKAYKIYIKQRNEKKQKIPKRVFNRV